METTESPLEVLSRAATMVQDSSPPDYECGAGKTLPGGRWRRDRRDKVSARHRSQQLATPDAPLDMTTPRGLPPPYSACAGSRARTSARPSVITCLPTRARREQLSDPVIDEHFRRSLGNDYNNVFRDEEGEASTRQENSVTVTGLSVDDHFAKALGDTWTKLQKSDSTPAVAPTTPATATPAKDKLLPPRRGLVTI